MPSVQVTITPDNPAVGEKFEIETLDVVTALAVTEINVTQGTAEIWDGEQRLARLRKRGDEGAAYWEVG